LFIHTSSVRVIGDRENKRSSEPVPCQNSTLVRVDV
jgi:hypothetical protein